MMQKKETLSIEDLTGDGMVFDLPSDISLEESTAAEQVEFDMVESTVAMLQRFTVAAGPAREYEPIVRVRNLPMEDIMKRWVSAKSSDLEYADFRAFGADDYLVFAVNEDALRIETYLIKDVRATIDANYPEDGDSEDEDEDSNMGLIGRCIAKIEVSERFDGQIWLQHIVVLARFQRNGIGCQLIKLACDLLDLKYFPSGSRNGDDDYYLSQEGAALINSCIRQQIIPPLPASPVSTAPTYEDEFELEEDVAALMPR